MTSKNIRAALNIFAAVAALAAAILWYRASVVIVRPSESPDRDGWVGSQITVEHEGTGPFDPFLTSIAQSRMNKWAALAASFAAFIQAVVLLIPE